MTLGCVSVVLCTYNGEQFLKDQLDSLNQQTLLPLELITGDDHSTDSTLKIIQEFMPSAKFPVQVNVNETRLGYSENFLRSASRASAEFIAFCDQDDIWMPEKLERYVNALRKADDPLCSHTATLIDPSGKTIGLF